jgi:acyl dehydratase
MSDTATGNERVITSVAELKSLVGQEMGVSDWLEITQEQVNLFADATGDHQYIHIDPERAKETFFGGTIAHGFMTISLSHVLRAMTPVRIDLGGKLIVNYGLNTVRFTAPVPVGKRLRMRTKLTAVEEIGDQAVQIEQVLTFEVEDSDRSACFAETLIRVYF